MADKLVDIIHVYFNNNLYLQELDSIKLRYTLQVIINNLSKSACVFFWGEPECPEKLKENIAN
ncbi:cyclic lactone autoinducer peptide [Clostridium sp. D2Q-11]|uniref:Cyclic lactone autoinducer peptide n=1 Tax=Anaeromonas frigoriresistens TaxID=2683708 RepID=A0A942V323_9FIRM|nr:cyclic lactone autoinducer peptide [Anaeromonas frigoriresistens]MBS4539057.1 cyclic lactone autoinducer peptide [Anaeromonas frigoriresistens]